MATFILRVGVFQVTPISNPFNQWAEKPFSNWRLPSVQLPIWPRLSAYVKSEDYASCNTGSPYAKFSDGHTVFKLNQSGPHFFISGNKDNCLKNEKLTVIVLADRSNRSSSNNNQTSTASPPSPQSSTPSPAPSQQEGQSPPPDQTNSTPAPVSEPPPPNGAAQSLSACRLCCNIHGFNSNFISK
ncbi:Phytocyanin domain [Sesbania bispinosa]|nr:Phytocyanin domain [Sesbania bispinosa]